MTWLGRLWASLRDPERRPECGLTRQKADIPVTGEMATIFKLPVAIGRHFPHLAEAIARIFGTANLLNLAPSWNVAPTQARQLFAVSTASTDRPNSSDRRKEDCY